MLVAIAGHEPLECLLHLVKAHRVLAEHVASLCDGSSKGAAKVSKEALEWVSWAGKTLSAANGRWRGYAWHSLARSLPAWYEARYLLSFSFLSSLSAMETHLAMRSGNGTFSSSASMLSRRSSGMSRILDGGMVAAQRRAAKC